MSQVVVPLIVNALAFFLPALHIVGVTGDALTVTIQTLVLIVSGIWITVRHGKVVAAARRAGAHI